MYYLANISLGKASRISSFALSANCSKLSLKAFANSFAFSSYRFPSAQVFFGFNNSLGTLIQVLAYLNRKQDDFDIQLYLNLHLKRH